MGKATNSKLNAIADELQQLEELIGACRGDRSDYLMQLVTTCRSALSPAHGQIAAVERQLKLAQGDAASASLSRMKDMIERSAISQFAFCVKALERALNDHCQTSEWSPLAVRPPH